MVGGRIIVLGFILKDGEFIIGFYCGIGMYGGVMYFCGELQLYQFGKEVKVVDMEEEDYKFIDKYVIEFVKFFGYSKEYIMLKLFYKLIFYNKCLYGKLYVY